MTTTVPDNLQDIVSPYRYLYFIHIPKTGGTHICRGLFGLEKADYKNQRPLRRPFHSAWHRYCLCVNPLRPVFRKFRGRCNFRGTGEYLKFAVVRNPFDHLVSIYHYQDGAGRGWGGLARGHDDFAAFVRDWCDLSIRGWADHFRRRLSFQLYDNSDRCRVNLILKLEHLDEGMEHLCSAMQIALPSTERRNVNRERRRDYRDYYPEPLRRLVEETYRYELGAYGYDFENGSDGRVIIDAGRLPSARLPEKAAPGRRKDGRRFPAAVLPRGGAARVQKIDPQSIRGGER